MLRDGKPSRSRPDDLSEAMGRDRDAVDSPRDSRERKTRDAPAAGCVWFARLQEGVPRRRRGIRANDLIVASAVPVTNTRVS